MHLATLIIYTYMYASKTQEIFFLAIYMYILYTPKARVHLEWRIK